MLKCSIFYCEQYYFNSINLRVTQSILICLVKAKFERLGRKKLKSDPLFEGGSNCVYIQCTCRCLNIWMQFFNNNQWCILNTQLHNLTLSLPSQIQLETGLSLILPTCMVVNGLNNNFKNIKWQGVGSLSVITLYNPTKAIL